MAENGEIDWNQGALDAFIAECGEELLPGLAQEVEDTARAYAPVRVRKAPYRRKRHHASGAGGALKESVQTEMGEDTEGPYADVAALWYGRFLDPKARQLHRLIPLLPSALYDVLDGRTFGDK